MEKKAIVIPGWLACISNRNLCQRTRDYLKLNGYELCASFKKADLIVYSGCAVSEGCELQSLAELAYIEKEVKAAGKGQRLVLIGCLPKINKKTKGAHTTSQGEEKHKIIGEEYVPDPNAQFVVVDNYDYAILDQLVGATVPFSEVPHPPKVSSLHGMETVKFSYNAMGGYPVEQKTALQRSFLEQAELQSKIAAQGFFYPVVCEFLAVYGYNQITIGRGCKNNCAYCAIKFSKDKLKSILPETIISQIKGLLEKGETKFVLICDDLASWGLDMKMNWKQLLEQIMNIDAPDLKLGLFNVRAEDWLDEKEFIDKYVEQGKITYIGAMVQHVNSRILNVMRRRYFDKQKFIDAVNEYGEKNVHIHTYNLVGFPSETEEEFEELIDYIKSIKTINYSALNFAYTERKGTAAESYAGKLPKGVVRERVNKLNTVYAEASKQRFSSLPEELSQTIIRMHQVQVEHEIFYQNFLAYLSENIHE